MKKLLIVLLLIAINVEARPLGKRYTTVVSGGGVSTQLALISDWTDGVRLGNFDSSANWQELSGLATPQKSANSSYLWVISDSPANMLAAVSATNASSQGVYTLETPPAYVDWEDIEAETINGQEYLYVFDYGNNGGGADSRGAGIDMRIFRIQEPTINGSGGVIAAANRIDIDAVFPAGNLPVSRDMECSLVDENGTIWFITKRDVTQKVYSLPHAASYTGTQTLTYAGAMTSIAASRTHPLGATDTYCVDAAISPNGKEILIKNYSDIYLFTRNPSTQTVYQALQGTPTVIPSYVGGGTISPRKSHPNAEPQGEGITFSPSGDAYFSHSEYLSSEGSTAARYPLFKYTRSARAATTVSFQDGVAPTAGYAGTTDTYIWDTNPTTNYGTQTTFVLDKAIGVETDQRKALVRFDLSSIPSTATVIGCKLEWWISAEGQGWTWYRMLVPWVETTSTYNTLVTGVNDDNVEASSTESVRNGINLDTIVSVTVRDNVLVSDCQNMVSNPGANYGWLGESTDITGGDGVQFDSRESVTATRRPKLTIRYY